MIYEGEGINLVYPEEVSHIVKRGVKTEFHLRLLSDTDVMIFASGTCGCTNFPQNSFILNGGQPKDVLYTVTRNDNYNGTINLYKKDGIKHTPICKISLKVTVA